MSPSVSPRPEARSSKLKKCASAFSYWPVSDKMLPVSFPPAIPFPRTLDQGRKSVLPCLNKAWPGQIGQFYNNKRPHGNKILHAPFRLEYALILFPLVHINRQLSEPSSSIKQTTLLL